MGAESELGVGIVKLDVDMAPLLAGFDRAQEAALKAGRETSQAFEDGQAEAAQQARVAKEAGEAFSVMGQVQTAAAKRTAASLADLGDVTLKLKPRFRFASESAQDLSRSLDGTKIAGHLAGKALGEVSGAGGLAGSVMGQIASKAGPWGVAIAGIATALGFMFKSFTLAKGAAKDIAEIDKVLEKAGRRAAEVHAAEGADLQASAENAALAASRQRLSDMGLGWGKEAPSATNNAELTQLRQALEDAEDRARVAQTKLNASGVTFGPMSAERKEEAEALAALTIARDNLTAAEAKGAFTRKQADEAARDAEEIRSKKALDEVLADLAKTRAKYAEETASFVDRFAQLQGGQDPEVGKRKREIEEVKREADRLMSRPDDLSRAKGFGLQGQAERMQEALGALVNFNALSQLDKIQKESVNKTADAMRRIDDLQRTAGERALAELQQEHDKELLEIQRNGDLTAEAKARAIRVVEDRQALEVQAVQGEQHKQELEAQKSIDEAVAEEMATAAEKEILIVKAKYDALIKLAKEHGIEIAPIVAAQTHAVAAVQAAAVKPAVDQSKRAAREHELYASGETQEAIQKTLEKEGYQLERTAQSWHRYAGAIAESREALVAMAKYRLQQAKENVQASLFRSQESDMISSHGAVGPGIDYAFMARAAHDELARAQAALTALGVKSATGFASGGTARVAGAGARDSKLVTMALTPGELVEVHRNDQGSGKPVTVMNFTGEPAEVREVGPAFAREFIVTVGRALGGDARRGGDFGRLMEATYSNLERRTRRNG